MANKRMFSKDIVAGSQFIMLPHSAQNLYFHIGMHADDDGYCEYVSVMRLIAASDEDLRTLQEQGFVCVYNLYTLCIQGWYTHNKLPPSRYTASKYVELFPDRNLPLKEQYNPTLTEPCIQSVHKPYEQDRVVKGSIGKGSIVTTSVDEIPKPDKKEELASSILEHFNKITGRDNGNGRPITLTGKTKSQIMARIKEGYKLEDFKHVSEVCHHNWNDDKEFKGRIHPITIFNNEMDKRLVWEKRDKSRDGLTRD